MAHPLPATVDLRQRMRELVEDGPIKARDAYAVLVAEGYSPRQIDRVRRSVVLIRGLTKASWWRQKPTRPMGPAKQPASVERALRAVTGIRQPARMVTTSCVVCRVTVVRLDNEVPRCHKPRCQPEDRP